MKLLFDPEYFIKNFFFTFHTFFSLSYNFFFISIFHLFCLVSHAIIFNIFTFPQKVFLLIQISFLLFNKFTQRHTNFIFLIIKILFSINFHSSTFFPIFFFQWLKFLFRELIFSRCCSSDSFRRCDTMRIFTLSIPSSRQPTQHNTPTRQSWGRRGEKEEKKKMIRACYVSVYKFLFSYISCMPACLSV